MFTERLQQIKDRLAGALAVCLVAHDGIPVESVVTDDSLDLEFLSAELMSQVHAISHNHQELSVGHVQQFSVTTERMVLMVGALTQDYFLLLALEPGASFGRARFELRRAILQFEKDLV